MKPIVIASVAATLGVVSAAMFMFSRSQSTAADNAAMKAGFKSSEAYKSGLSLVDLTSKTHHIPADRMNDFEYLVKNEGERGQIMALVIMLPIRDLSEQSNCVEVADAALANPNNKVMASTVLSTYSNTNPQSVQPFFDRHPELTALAQGAKQP